MNFRFKDNWLWYMLVVLLLAGNIFLLVGRYKANRDLMQALASERLQSTEKERAVLVQQLEFILSQDMLLYSEMIREDLEAEKWKPIRAEFQRIVRLTGVQSLEIIAESGQVLVSNDLKQEGKSKSIEYDARTLFNDQSVHHKHLPGETISSLRLMQDSSILGFLVMHYSDLTANMLPH